MRLRSGPEESPLVSGAPPTAPRVTKAPQIPEVTFFVESREESARAEKDGLVSSRGEFLFNILGEREFIEALQSTRGRIAIALNAREIADDDRLVDLLRVYNILELPVDIWPTLQDEDGYWIHAGNMKTAHGEVFRLIEELERKQIDFANVGLDLEFPIELMKDGMSLKKLVRMKPWQHSQAEAGIYLTNLIDEIHRTSKYGVHLYEVPILSDHPWLRRALAIPPASEVQPLNPGRVKRVGLVYTSATPKIVARDRARFVKKYSAGRERVPAIGIVSATGKNPGRDLEPLGPGGLLNDEELRRDVRAALEVSPEEFFVFAANGASVVTRTREAVEAALGAYFPVKI